MTKKAILQHYWGCQYFPCSLFKLTDLSEKQISKILDYHKKTFDGKYKDIVYAKPVAKRIAIMGKLERDFEKMWMGIKKKVYASRIERGDSLTVEVIESLITALFKEARKSKYIYLSASSVMSVSNLLKPASIGGCDTMAQYIVNALPENSAKCVEVVAKAFNERDDYNYVHQVVFYNNKYYDLTTPNGSEQLKDMKYFSKFNSDSYIIRHEYDIAITGVIS